MRQEVPEIQKKQRDMTNPIDRDDSPTIDSALRLDDDLGSAGMHVKLSIDDVLSFTDDSRTLYVFGGPGDSVDAGGGWTALGQETVDGAVFNIYTRDSAVLKVDCDIDQSLIGLA
jgi:hypothetical protein